MFDSTREVPSLELCKKLKELGYPQHHYGFIWAKFKKGEDFCLLYNEGDYNKDMLKICFDEWHKAPTVHELGEWLPIDINLIRKIENSNAAIWIVYSKAYKYSLLHKFSGQTISNAMAKMLIWLVENDYISFNGGHND